MRVASTKPSTFIDARDSIAPAYLRGLGVCVPALVRSQAELADELATLWSLDPSERNRLDRIAAATGIETRCAVRPISDVIGCTTAQRMTMYETDAPQLAEPAARRALENANTTASDVTDIVVVSCTGFAAPGVDVALIERLGLNTSVRRSTIGFMGCFGAINGLRAAVGACAADPSAIVLVVCVELCTLHLRGDADIENQIASMLFADGAAAAVVAGKDAVVDESAAFGRLTLGSSVVLPEGADWMSWKIGDHGFRMTLTRDVPMALRSYIPEFVDRAEQEAEVGRIRQFVVHPGGPEILQAVGASLNIQDTTSMASASSVLREFGNMSSATVLHVLQRSLNENVEPPIMLLAFGPGLTIESITLGPASSGSPSDNVVENCTA